MLVFVHIIFSFSIFMHCLSLHVFLFTSESRYKCISACLFCYTAFLSVSACVFASQQYRFDLFFQFVYNQMPFDSCFHCALLKFCPRDLLFDFLMHNYMWLYSSCFWKGRLYVPNEIWKFKNINLLTFYILQLRS